MTTPVHHLTHRRPAHRRAAARKAMRRREGPVKRGGAGVKTGWFATLIQTITGSPSPDYAAEPNASLEDVQEMFLELLEPLRTEQAGSIRRRATAAVAAKSLWYLRPELLVVLSGPYGEEEASEQVRRITLMLEPMLPGHWHSRPSPLASN